MTRGELAIIDRYLNALQGSREAMDALTELIGLADDRRNQWAASRLARSRG